jgi:hypothetical protein
MNHDCAILKFNFSRSKIRQRTTKYAKHESLLPEKLERNLRSIQHSAQLKFHQSYFRVRSTDVTQRFQQKPSPFKLIALVGKLDQVSGAT